MAKHKGLDILPSSAPAKGIDMPSCTEFRAPDGPQHVPGESPNSSQYVCQLHVLTIGLLLLFGACTDEPVASATTDAVRIDAGATDADTADTSSSDSPAVELGAGDGDLAAEEDGLDAPGSDGSVDSDVAAEPDAPFCGDGLCDAAEDTTSCLADCGPCANRPANPTPFEQTLLDMPADSWFEARNTQMRDVCVPDAVGVGGTGGCGAVIDAFSGGAYDGVRNQMILWGGGRDDYHGNELYAFDVPSGAWRRLTQPTTVDFTDRDPLPDGNPVSRHTYDALEVITQDDSLWAHGGLRASDSAPTLVTWIYDLAQSQWTSQNPTVPGPGGFAIGSAYDALSRRVLYRGTRDFFSYDVEANTWAPLKFFESSPEWPRYERNGTKTAAIDPTRRLFWSVGSGDILVWNIDTSSIVTDQWVTTGGGVYTNADHVEGNPEQVFVSGGGDVYNSEAPGLAYDIAADQLVAWANDGGPYRLNLQTRVWTQGSGDGAPTSQTYGGTFGRWRYIPDYNVFILVNDVYDDVVFYKNTACN